MTRAIRNLIHLGFWTVVWFLALGVTLVVLFSNYLGCLTGFEWLNFEPKPLYTDMLVGSIFSALPGGEATLAHLFALAITLTLSIGLFIFFHLMFSVYRLYQDRQSYIDTGETEHAKLAMREILFKLVTMLIFAIPLVFAIRWDLALFKYRSIVFASGIDSMAMAPTQVKIWSLELKENGQLFAWPLAGIGAWGYVGITALSCLVLEFGFSKVEEYLLQLIDVLAGKPTPAEVEGTDLRIHSANGSMFTHAHTANSAPFSPAWDAEPIANTPHVAASMEKPAESEPLSSTPKSYTDGVHSENRTVDDEAIPFRSAPTASGPDLTGADAQEADLCTVIGGKLGEQVSFSEAISQPQTYYVDPETHEIWLRQFREEAFG